MVKMPMKFFISNTNGCHFYVCKTLITLVYTVGRDTCRRVLGAATGNCNADVGCKSCSALHVTMAIDVTLTYRSLAVNDRDRYSD